MKKLFRKLVCLTVLASMLLGLNGCALMIQNMKKEDVKQETPELKVEDSTVNQAENNKPEAGEVH